MENWDRRDLSQALLLAQQKLNSLRDLHREKGTLPCPILAGDGRKKQPPKKTSSQPRLLPDHLGWGSVPLTHALRRAVLHKGEVQMGESRPGTIRKGQEQQQPALRKDDAGEWVSLAAGHQPEPLQEQQNDRLFNRNQVKLYPDLALRMLAEKQVAAVRIWLLLQLIDEPGRGWLNVATAREQLTNSRSALHICGWRQLRKLLSRGEGCFWTRTADRIWLRSAAKVAASLGVTQLSGRPVALPISVLLEGIGSVRAHFYASFHSGRQRKDCSITGNNGFDHRSGPLSRATLETLSHVKPRTQRRYEKRAKIQSQPNFVVSRQSNSGDIQEQAWRRGRAWFRFTDHAGKLGEKGAVYSAWQLPNSYRGPHEQQPIGRQKRINQELADLFMKGMTGNGKDLSREEQDNPIGCVRVYHSSGSAASVSYNRQPEVGIYWRSRQRRSRRYELWHYLPGQGSR